MRTSTFAALLASLSFAWACSGPGPCCDTGCLRQNSYSGYGRNKPNGGKPSSSQQSIPLLPPIPVRRDLGADRAIAHYPRSALQRRDYYDMNDHLEGLSARDIAARDVELGVDLLYKRDADEYDLHDLSIRGSDDSYVTLPTSPGSRGPYIPKSLDPSKSHMFTRLNTIPKAYSPSDKVNHAGLNKLMADLGGQHVDAVFGNLEGGYKECGMALVDMEWTTTHSNADGYPVFANCHPLHSGPNDEFTYVGSYGGEATVEELCKESLPAVRGTGAFEQ
ncbi:hypothetical protein MMC10_002669 [Thelotrema lepadinum]|nr:hypothetical protein [Thelotrema lepadinum]